MKHERIEFIKPENLGSEVSRLWEVRVDSGFYEKFVRHGKVVDIGYKGGNNSSPLFIDALGLDIDTPGYDGVNFPFHDDYFGTIHASHVLEHIADYGHFLRECLRTLQNKGTLLLFVPLMDSYERKLTPPSIWNSDHKRFYTSSRLLYEIETSIPRESYKIIHLYEQINFSDLYKDVTQHASGPYEIECVIEKS